MINHQTSGSTWSKMTSHGWSWTIRIWWLRIVEPAWNGDIEPISYEISLDSTRVLSVTSIQYQGDRVTMAVTNLTDLGSRSGRPSLYADLKRQILNTYSQNNVLVGGFNPSEKYESQLGLWTFQYMESHKIHVPVTTNQILMEFPITIQLWGYPHDYGNPWEIPAGMALWKPGLTHFRVRPISGLISTYTFTYIYTYTYVYIIYTCIYFL